MEDYYWKIAFKFLFIAWVEALIITMLEQHWHGLSKSMGLYLLMMSFMDTRCIILATSKLGML